MEGALKADTSGYVYLGNQIKENYFFKCYLKSWNN